jgi:hypothetical protein
MLTQRDSAAGIAWEAVRPVAGGADHRTKHIVFGSDHGCGRSLALSQRGRRRPPEPGCKTGEAEDRRGRAAGMSASGALRLVEGADEAAIVL